MVEKLSSLGVLLKSELCQKCSKFCMQICLGLLTNVLHVFFFTEVCIMFEILHTCNLYDFKNSVSKGIVWRCIVLLMLVLLLTRDYV